jgi:hypothetical protein
MKYNSGSRSRICRDAINSILFVWCLLIGTFSNAQDQNSFDRKFTINSPWFVEFADLNGDKINDMVGVNGNSNTNIEIYHGTAEGTFNLVSTLNGGSGEYYSLLLPEFNGDGIPDIFAYSAISAKLFYSGPTGYTEVAVPTGSGTRNPGSAMIEDFNNDGFLDVFTTNECFINDGTGVFTSKSWLMGGGGLTTDYNNDGNADIVLVVNGDIQFNAGNGDGTFKTKVDIFLSVWEPTAFDVNADGLIDIIAHKVNGDIITMYNDPSHTFSRTSSFQPSSPYYSVIKFFDIDFDGKTDLVLSNDNDVQYRPILTDGTFGPEKNFAVGMGSLRALMFKDAIGDPFPDLVVMSGFGRTKFYSDKLDASIEFTSKTYDGLPFTYCYKTTPEHLNASIAYTNGNAPKDAGAYQVKAAINDPNYEGEQTGTATIVKKVLTVDVMDIPVGPGEDLPPYQLVYSGFVGTETAAVLTQAPVAHSEVTLLSEEGEYEITISGGQDDNYAFEYLTGTISVNIINGIADENVDISVFPNPSASRLNINGPAWQDLKLIDTTGRSLITSGYTTEAISIEQLDSGLYILQLRFANGTSCRKRIQIN